MAVKKEGRKEGKALRDRVEKMEVMKEGRDDEWEARRKKEGKKTGKY